ncbi:hypothetical protein [Pseudodesulfovibrio indicus]|uniref:hypothetical protein n=1 Tax=Pseudodesulfovibrio indicus TaxID=1716143 RepID=UPI00292F546B|nr:hypothetical protein [Pseudodesulfovibrio indicus]
MPQWLFDRFSNEDPSLRPDFALYGTTNWIRALSILAQDELSDEILENYYDAISPRTSGTEWENTVFQKLLMSLHNLASLEVMANTSEDQRYSVVRSAIIAWYYGVYTACGAMIAAQDGSSHETHAKTAQVWGSQIASTGKIPSPFNYVVTTLVKTDYEAEISEMRAGNSHDINTVPTNTEQAKGALLAYLKGSAKWHREKAESEIMKSADFRALGVTNFRTNSARSLRDSRLRNKSINLLHQAIRYRGKANYRDSLYLSYGNDYTSRINTLVEDLHITLTWFLKAAWLFSAKRTQHETWGQFKQDLSNYSRLNVSFDI